METNFHAIATKNFVESARSRGKLNCVGRRENLQGKWAVVGEISFFVGQMSYFDIFVAMKDITRYQGSIFK